jgi:hypothetical protein
LNSSLRIAVAQAWDSSGLNPTHNHSYVGQDFSMRDLRLCNLHRNSASTYQQQIYRLI